jgi:hypothetical protein
MRLFKDMDLYKGIILLSIILIPAACGFVVWVDGQIEEANEALAAAVRTNGELEQIGQARKELETVRENTDRTDGSDSHRLYFERSIMSAAKSGLKAEDFAISNEASRAAGRSSQDQEVTITFRRDGKDVPWPRDFISAALFNSEVRAKGVWRLRSLKIRNDEIRELGAGKKTPPKTVADTWRIEKLVFARREPRR